MGSAVHSLKHSPCVPSSQFLAVAVSGEADPYTIGQVLTGQTAGGVITGVTYGHGLGKVAGFPYTAVHAVAPWSTDTLLDIPSCTARGRLRLSQSHTPSDRSLPEHTLPALLPTADLTM